MRRSMHIAGEALALVAALALRASAVEFATGYSEDPDARAAAAAAARQAKGRLGGKAADVVIVWSNYGTKAAVAGAVHAALKSEFPGVPICGQAGGARNYSAYTEDGTATGRGISVLAMGGVSVKTAHVTGIDGDGHSKEENRAKARELCDLLKPFPADARLLIVMGGFHGKGGPVAAGVVDSTGKSAFPCVGGASSSGGRIFHRGEVIGKAYQAVLLSGDFRVNFAKTTVHGGWQPQYTPQIKAAAEGEAARETLDAVPRGATAKGLIWFNCAGRAVKKYGKKTAEERLADRALHHSAVKAAAKGTPFWGHYSGNECGKESNDANLEGSGYIGVFALLYDD